MKFVNSYPRFIEMLRADESITKGWSHVQSFSSKTTIFLLRCWIEQSGDDYFWRYRVENPHTGENATFATLETLHAFLETQLDNTIKQYKENLSL